MRVGVGGGSFPGTVVVAVKRAEGRGTQRAVKWAVENLMGKADDRLLLVHVMPRITCVPTPSGGNIPIKDLDANVAEMYVQDARAKCKEEFLVFKYQYEMYKIEIMLLEGENPAFALLRYISDSGISSLVLGSCSSKYFSRKENDSEVPSIILKHAPDSCDVYVVSANKLVSNSLNPMLNAERQSGSSRLYSKQESSVSSSSTDTPRSSSLYPDAVSRVNRFSEDGISYCSGNRRSQSMSSTHSQQSSFQAEIESLRAELDNALTLYNRACEDLVYAQRKVELLSSECVQEAKKVDAAQKREETLRRIATVEKQKYLEAEKEVEISKRKLAKETFERKMAELNARKESLERQKIIDELLTSDRRYRKYSRNDIQVATESFSGCKLIGEGAFGKVYKCSLDHTSVAVKVLHPHASDRKEEFLREVEVLSRLRHPNIVLLLGACPELGCLVYEYMENGSLEDHILRRRNRPPLPWPTRFRIAFEVACGLAYLHNARPDPIVHRDLKPGNILLDRHFTGKISDVGLATIISDLVPDNVTEYRESVIAGTLFYMDPEYQRTGTLRPKSDVYSLGVIIMQLLAGQHPNGLITKFENAVGNSSFSDVLDQSVRDWSLELAEEMARVALRCCKLRCRDRPDLDEEVLPILRKLAERGEASNGPERDPTRVPPQFYCPILQEIMDDPYIAGDGFTYEHDAIKAWFNRHDVSPLTKQKVKHKVLIPNHMLRSAIEEWRKNTASPSVLANVSSFSPV